MANKQLINNEASRRQKSLNTSDPFMAIEWLSWLLFLTLSLIFLAQILNAIWLYSFSLSSLWMVERTMLWLSFACLLVAFISIYREKRGRLMLCLATVFSLLFTLSVVDRAWPEFQAWFLRNPDFYGFFMSMTDFFYAAIGLVTFLFSLFFLFRKVVKVDNGAVVENPK